MGEGRREGEVPEEEEEQEQGEKRRVRHLSEARMTVAVGERQRDERAVASGSEALLTIQGHLQQSTHGGLNSTAKRNRSTELDWR